MKTIDIVAFKELVLSKVTKSYAYKMGVDCSKNGANETNCNFLIFSTLENTKEWERGKAAKRN